MEAVGCGYFHAFVEDFAAGALYRYRLNDEKVRPDPAAGFQRRGVHGPSQIVNSRFSWNDSDWRGLPLEKYVLYELHVGTFTPQGTFDAIIPRLPALKNLGVTAIELMPVAQFPGNRNWGPWVFLVSAQITEISNQLLIETGVRGPTKRGSSQ